MIATLCLPQIELLHESEVGPITCWYPMFQDMGCTFSTSDLLHRGANLSGDKHFVQDNPRRMTDVVSLCRSARQILQTKFREEEHHAASPAPSNSLSLEVLTPFSSCPTPRGPDSLLEAITFPTHHSPFQVLRGCKPVFIAPLGTLLLYFTAVSPPAWHPLPWDPVDICL